MTAEETLGVMLMVKVSDVFYNTHVEFPSADPQLF